MKRFVAITLTTIMLMSSLTYAGDIGVQLNGESISFSNQEPVIVNDRTLVPLRGIFDKLGYTIAWDGDTKTATLTKEDIEIKVTANSDTFVVNGLSISADVPAQIINSSMMLPLRAISELAGADVSWDKDTKTVSISTELDKEVIDKNTDAISKEESTETTTQAQSKREKLEQSEEDYDIESYITNMEYRIFCDNIISITGGIISSAKDDIDYAYKHDNYTNYEADLSENIEMLESIESVIKKHSAPSNYQDLKTLTTKYVQASISFLETTKKLNSSSYKADDILAELENITDDLEDLYDQFDDAYEKQADEDAELNDNTLSSDDSTDEENAAFETYAKKVVANFLEIFTSIPDVHSIDYSSVNSYVTALSKQATALKNAASKGEKTLEKTPAPEHCADQNEIFQIAYDYFQKRCDITTSYYEGDIAFAEYYILDYTYQDTQLYIMSMFTGINLYDELNED